MEERRNTKKMKTKLLFTFIISLTSFVSKSQDTITISPKVGAVIDSSEKTHYRLFPYYSSKIFVSAVFFKTSDSTITLHSLLRKDSIAERKISMNEFLFIKNMIDNDYAGKTETQKSAATHTSLDSALKVSGRKILTLSPLLKLKYEHYLYAGNSPLSAGISLQPYFPNKRNFKGIKVKTYARIYITKRNRHSGFYLQANVNGGYYSGKMAYGSHYENGFWIIAGYNAPDTSVTRSFYAFGTGISTGYEWLLGKRKRFVIDWEIIGFNYIPLPKNEQTVVINGSKKNLFYE